MRPEITDPKFDVMKLQSRVLLGTKDRFGSGTCARAVGPAGFILRDGRLPIFPVPTLPDGKIN